MTFGEKLQRLRKANSLTQEALAQQLGVSRQTLSKWESGTVLPDTENVLRLSTLFSVSIDDLLKEVREEPQKNEPPVDTPAQNRIPLLRILGGVLSVLSLLGLLVLGIIGKWGDYEISPSEAATLDGIVVRSTGGKRGFPAFWEIQHLDWLFWLLILLTAAGGLLILRDWWKRHHL